MAEKPKLRAAGEIVMEVVDTAVTNRWDAAVRRADATPGADIDAQVRALRKSFARELATVGAAAGGTAASPGVGTVAGLSVAGSEFAWTTTRGADLILTIGAIHGHEGASLEERRAWILAVLLFGETASVNLGKLTTQTAKGLGKKATDAISVETLRAINRTLGRTVLTKYGTKRGAVAIGRLLPFGIGAAIGGTANYVLVRGVSRHADSFFRDLPGPLRDVRA